MDQAQLSSTNESTKRDNLTQSQTKAHQQWNDDIFSLRTIEECEENFEEYCEHRIFQFAESKEKLSILRSCLDLLNRLEGTAHKRFAGRVLIFLARVLPLYDQSGVNLRSDFYAYSLPDRVKGNIEQVNEQTKQNNNKSNGDGKTVKHEEADMEEGETLSDDEDDYHYTPQPKEDTTRLYERFWRTQQYLHQPNQLFDKNVWLTFKLLVDTLMIHFERKPTTCKVWSLKNSYMTEPKSFSLQLNDVNFRRCFLVQVLIAIQYLGFNVESRPDHLILDKNQALWIDQITERIFSLLSSTPNKKEGLEFCALVSQVLKNEELWNQWKNEKCKEPKLPSDGSDDDMINMGITYHKRRKMSDELKCAKPYNLVVIGSQEMSRLWNKRAQLPNAPDLIRYFTAPQERQLESFKNPNTSFRILRLLRKSPYFFQPTKDSIKSLKEYLAALSDKHFNVQSNQNQAQQQTRNQINNNDINNSTTADPQLLLTQHSTTPKGTTPNATPTPPNSNSNESTPNIDLNCRETPSNTSPTTPPPVKMIVENGDSTS